MPSIFDRIFGSLLLGAFFSSLLFGVITVQAKFYFAKFKRDPIATKILVGLLWVMQGFQVAVTTRGVYYYLITSQLDIFNLVYETWELSYYGTHTVLVSAIVQIFFTHRLWTISRNRIVAALIGLLIVSQLVFGLIVTIRSYIYTLQTDTHAHETWSVYSWLTLSAAADTAIALGLVFVLRKQRTGFATADTVLNWIILYGITTGTITSVLAIILLFCYAVGGRYETLLLIGIPLGGVYIMALLTNLHTRTSLRARMLKEKEKEPEPYKLSPRPVHYSTSEKSVTTNATRPKSEVPSPQTAPFPAAWPFIPTAPTTVASSTRATATGTTSATGTVSSSGVGTGRGTISKGTVGTVGTGVTEDTVATNGTAGTADTAVERSSRQLRFSEDTIFVVDRSTHNGQNRPSLDEQDEIVEYYINSGGSHVQPDHQNGHPAVLETTVTSPALDFRWAQEQQQTLQPAGGRPLPPVPGGHTGSIADLIPSPPPKAWVR